MKTLMGEGQPALAIWTRKEVAKLWNHLQNSNGPMEYVMGFRDKGTQQKTYKRSKNVPVNRGITWALESSAGRKALEKALAFVPYSTNSQQESRWAAMDFDAHDGNVSRARGWALAAFEALRHYDFATILESSGSGGWHVWVITECFKPASFWTGLLKGVAREIGAAIADGLCEIFPPDSLSRGFGKGLRAPGCWNPGTNQCSLIHWQNCEKFLDQLPEFSPSNRRIGEMKRIYSGTSSIEKEIVLSSLFLSVWEELVGAVRGCRIVAPSTRHHKLEDLTGAIFHQVSHTVALYIVQAQYREKTAPSSTPESIHLEEFESLWKGMEESWLASLKDGERERHSQLSTEAEKSAFRIIRSYHRKATQDGATDFPIVRDNLGQRLGITPEGAGGIRKKLVAHGIIEITKPYKPNVAAARFRWVAGISRPF